MQTSLLGIANKARVIQAITLVLLRKRVFTKSPVRENRTPGSVRGLSGNWQSYRAQLFTSEPQNCSVSSSCKIVSSDGSEPFAAGRIQVVVS